MRVYFRCSKKRARIGLYVCVTKVGPVGKVVGNKKLVYEVVLTVDDFFLLSRLLYTSVRRSNEFRCKN